MQYILRIALALFFSWTALAHSMTPQCKEIIIGFIAQGPGDGWIYKDHVRDLHVRIGHETGNIEWADSYECDSCGVLNPCKNNHDQFTKCIGCGDPYNIDIPVHEVEGHDGRIIIHIDAFIFEKETEPTDFPWNCSYCGKANNHDAKNCSKCAAPRGKSIMKPVGRVTRRKVTQDSSRARGVDLVKEPRRSESNGADAGSVSPNASINSDENRRQNMMRLLGVGAVVLAPPFAWWYTRDGKPPIQAPAPKPAKLVKKSWARLLIINTRDKDGAWKPFKTFRADETSSNTIQWPTVPKEFKTDPKTYQIASKDHYVLNFDMGGKIRKKEVDLATFVALQEGAKVELLLYPNGGVAGIRKVTP